MAETDRAARIAERLMELRPKKRRRSVNALLIGMERIFKQTRATDDEGAEPRLAPEPTSPSEQGLDSSRGHGAARQPRRDLSRILDLEGDDGLDEDDALTGGDGDDDEPSQDELDALERQLEAEGIDDPFAAGIPTEVTVYTEAWGELEDVLDRDLDHAACLQVGQALVALRNVLQSSGQSSEPLDQLEDDLEDPQPS